MSQKFPFPTTLHQVGANVADGYDYTSAMKEFIDSLIRDLKAKGVSSADGVLPIPEEAFRDEPPHLASAVQRAHLAGMAEYLANLSAQPSPAWVERPEFFLSEPVFFGGSAARDRTLAETPGAFRRRLLFCGRALIKLFTAIDGGR